MHKWESFTSSFNRKFAKWVAIKYKVIIFAMNTNLLCCDYMLRARIIELFDASKWDDDLLAIIAKVWQ